MVATGIVGQFSGLRVAGNAAAAERVEMARAVRGGLKCPLRQVCQCGVASCRFHWHTRLRLPCAVNCGRKILVGVLSVCSCLEYKRCTQPQAAQARAPPQRRHWHLNKKSARFRQAFDTIMMIPVIYTATAVHAASALSASQCTLCHWHSQCPQVAVPRQLRSESC